MPHPSDPSRDLLFGLLALQVGLIDQGTLVAGFQAWARDRSRPLAGHLQERGGLEADQLAAIEALVALHLRKYGSTDRSLAALSPGPSTREQLASVGDDRLDASLAMTGPPPSSIPTDPRDPGPSDVTATYDVGEATSEGLRFRVLRPHARGGLGAVFVALDSELPREVALKQILDHHADDPGSRQRFLLEAEITGGLEHPGIVPVYGLGTYGDGRPFYAMRFIRGDSLKEAIERFHADERLGHDPGARSLALRSLLRRFLDVCNAIEYAHNRGVLHRDIKPGNVIVGKHGETLVVDWGLAKLQGRPEAPGDRDEPPLRLSSASGSAETLPGSALGTPAYMSPEQARGQLDQLGPRSDVYSLGATLYCLLTGSPPQQGDVAEVIRAVQRGEFRTPRQRDPRIDRALEAVCLKAMALRPEDRYASARAMADDVERWIADEPVSAMREPVGARLARWARRHRPAVAALGLSLVTAVVLLAILNLLVGRAQHATARALVRVKEEQARTSDALQRADANFRRARQAVEDYFTTVSQEMLLDEPGTQPLRGKLLRSALKYHEEFLKERAGDASAEADLAESHRRFANLAVITGLKEDPIPHLQEALVRYRRLVARHPEHPDYRFQEAMTLGDLGVLLANYKDRREEGIRSLLAAISVYEQLLRGRAGDTTIRESLAVAHADLGLKLAEKRGGIPEALRHYELARRILQELVAENPGNLGFKRQLAELHNSLYDSVVGNRQRQAEALQSSQEAMKIYGELLRESPESPRFQSRLGLIHLNRSALFARGGDLATALREAGLARGFLKEAVRLNPRVPDYQEYLALASERLGEWLGATGASEAALEALRESSEIWSRYVEVYPTTSARSSYNQALMGYAANTARLHRFEEAAAALRKCCEVGEQLVRADPENIFVAGTLMGSKLNLALVLSRSDRDHGHAVACFEAALAIGRQLFGGDGMPHDGMLDPGEIQLARAYSLREIGRVDEADRIVAGLRAKPGNAAAWHALADYDARGARRIVADPGSDPAATLLRDRALASLRRAVDMGFQDLYWIRKTGRLGGLEDRPEFKRLLLDAAFPSDVFVGSDPAQAPGN